MDETYKIVRFYRDREDMNRTVMETGLTLDEAQAHCDNPETSSSTCTHPDNVAHTELFGAWFDGYREE